MLRYWFCALMILMGLWGLPMDTAWAQAGKEAEKPHAGAGQAASQPDDEPDQRRGDPFYMTTCAACGQPRWHKNQPVVKLYDGRELRFCCPDCQTRFEADAAAGMAALDQVLINDQLPHYPVRTSIVSGSALGDKPVDFIWYNRLIRVADEAEKAEFMKNPEERMKALDRAVIEAQAPVYGMAKCPVQGEFFDPDEITNIVIGNRMIKLCCRRCVAVVRRNPGQYLVMVDYANREAAQKRRSKGV